MVLQRGTLIAVLVGVEIALVVMMAQAVNPAFRPAWQLQTLHDLSHFGSNAAPATTSATTSATTMNYSFAVYGDAELAVDIDNADVTIERGSGSHITVDVPHHGWHGFGSPAPITAHQEGNRVVVAAGSSSGWAFEDDRRVHITVTPSTRVTVTDAGIIETRGLRAAASLHSSDGHIEVADYDAPSLNVEAASGRVILHDVTTPQIDVASSDGRIEGSALHVTNGRISSSNGRVTLGFARGTDTTISAATSNGRVEVDGLVASPARTSSGDDDDDDAAAKTIRVGAGTGRLDVHAADGKITLSQEG